MSDVSSAKRTKRDMYSNIALTSVTMSAANTLTFAQLQIAVGMFQGVGMLIHRVLWYPHTTAMREIVASTDALFMALVTNNRLTSIENILDPSVVSLASIVGIGVAVESKHLPIISDFSNLPEGGKLIPANPLFIAASSGGFVSAALVRALIDFSFVSLADKDYLELMQSMYPVQV